MFPTTSTLKKLIPPSIGVMLLPLAFLIGLISLTTIAVKVGISNISSQRDQLSKIQKDESVLSAKETLLRRVGSVVLSQADASLGAVPEGNSSLIVISQLKSLAATKGVTITDFKVGNTQKSENNIFAIDVSFQVEGAVAQTFDFVASIASFSPLTTIEKVKMDQVAGATRMEVILRCYWAALPKTLPSLTQPLNELTSDEQEMLARLGSLSQPAFLNIAPSLPSGRTDPFGP